MRNRLVTVVLEAEQPRRLAKTAPSVQKLREAKGRRWQKRRWEAPPAEEPSEPVSKGCGANRVFWGTETAKQMTVVADKLRLEAQHLHNKLAEEDFSDTGLKENRLKEAKKATEAFRKNVGTPSQQMDQQKARLIQQAAEHSSGI
jgi:hypothetical protein